MGKNESGFADVKTRLFLTLALLVWLVRQNMFFACLWVLVPGEEAILFG